MVGYILLKSINRYDILVGSIWNIFYFSIQLGMSSSQLTNSFFSEVNHQITVVVSSGVVAIGFLLPSWICPLAIKPTWQLKILS